MKLVKEIESAVGQRLIAGGFRKVTRGNIYLKQLQPGTSIRAGVAFTTYRSGLVSGFPVMGIAFDSVYMLGSELGAYPDSTDHTVLSIPLEQLLPEGVSRDYEFHPGADNSRVCDRLTQDIESHGVAALSPLASIDEAMKYIETARKPALNDDEFFLPIAYLLRGDGSRALDRAAAHLAILDPKRGSIHQYKPFFEALSRKVSN